MQRREARSLSSVVIIRFWVQLPSIKPAISSIAISPSQTHGEALIAKIQDQAGNVGPDTSFNATNSGYPGVPVIISIVDDVTPSTGPLNNNQATNDTTPTISGTADANSTVNIYNNGALVVQRACRFQRQLDLDLQHHRCRTTHTPSPPQQPTTWAREERQRHSISLSILSHRQRRTI